MKVGLHQTQHVNKLKVGGFGIFIEGIIDLFSSVGNGLPFVKYPLSPSFG
jgi:hypothetical protein